MIVVTGYMDLKAGGVEMMRGPIANQVFAANRQDGCDAYGFAQDLFDENRLWVNERWRDKAAQAMHMIGDHVVEFTINMQRASIVRADINSFDPDGQIRRMINVAVLPPPSDKTETVIVMGEARLAAGEIDRLSGAMRTQVETTRTENGCVHYAFARDVLDPDRLIISERWRDQAALEAHFKMPHMATFNAVLGSAQILELSVKAYANGEARTLMGG